MTKILFVCDDASEPQDVSQNKWGKRVEILTQGNKANLHLQIDEINAAFLHNLSPTSEDLVRIASYIYAGDQFISRGTPKDIYGHKWTRNLHFVIPVSNPSFWSSDSVYTQLCDTLNFLTGDKYTFDFVQGSPTIKQFLLEIPDLGLSNVDADTVILLSGGTDSLCAVIEKVALEGRRPILVSHRPMPVLDSRQSKVVEELRRRFPEWVFPHISIWVHLRGKEAKDYTQRSRSFLYTALAAAIAHQTNINEIHIADNGIVSINLPINAQTVGANASRTTHPKFLHRVQNFFQSVYNCKVEVGNPLIFRTRAEVLDLLKENKCAELLQETVSCSRTRQPRVTPHCGVCSQCVDRRFASAASNMEEHDLPERYKIDIFTDPINEGPDRILVESYVRFAKNIRQHRDDDILREYPELIDCFVPGRPNVPQTAKALVDMLCRHADQVSQVMENQIKKHATSLYNVTLPASCLIRLVTSGSHIQDQRFQFASRVAQRFQRGLPKAFSSGIPENENEVQKVADAILAGAQEELHRELPLLAFAGISTKPDFSNLDSAFFYVEMKYIKTRPRLNHIVTEITSRITIYRKQGAFTLFPVYDPNRFILDDEKFINDLCSDNDQAKIVIIR